MQIEIDVDSPVIWGCFGGEDLEGYGPGFRRVHLLLQTGPAIIVVKEDPERERFVQVSPTAHGACCKRADPAYGIKRHPHRFRMGRGPLG